MKSYFLSCRERSIDLPHYTLNPIKATLCPYIIRLFVNKRRNQRLVQSSILQKIQVTWEINEKYPTEENHWYVKTKL